MNSDRAQVKRATELLVQSIGGIDEAAKALGKGTSTVGRWTNKNDTEYSIPLADARELEAIAPQPLIAMKLARLAGGVFVQLPIAPGCDQALPAKMMEVAAEFGDVSRCISEGLANGQIEDAEAERILDEVHEAEARLAELRMMLHMMKGRGK